MATDVKSAPEPMSCQQCLEALPTSVSRTCEGEEYVFYYCGIDCYDQWIAAGNADE